jgi:hypothetical protein
MAPAPLASLCTKPHSPGRIGATADWLERQCGRRRRF